MNEPEISPLAKRLAEENNVNWRALAGSGAGGKVVERDVLEYLARVMAGEEDTDPTPEPLPEGIDSWPEDDIVAYQDEIRPAQETPGLDTLQAELSASERSLGNTGSTDMLADAGVTDAGVTDASATDASATDASGNATAHLPDHLSGMEDDEDLWQDVGGAHEESTSGIEFAPLEPVADETPAPPAEEKFEDEDISEDIFLFGEGDVAEMEEMQETPAVDDDIPAAVAPEEFGSSSGGEEETIDPFAAAVEAGEVSSEAPPEVTGDDAVAGMDFEAPSQRDDVWWDHDDGAAGEGVQAAAESASYQDASEDVEKADPYTFEPPAEVSPTDDAAALQGEQAVGDKEVARGTGTEEELFAPLDAAVDFSPAQAPVEEDRTTDRATDVFASADAGREPESEETDVFLSEPTDADTAATPTPADVDWFAGGGEQMPITGEMPSESEESSIEAEKPDEVFEWGGEAAAATSEVEFAPAEPRVPGDEIVSPADTPAPQEEAAPEEYGQDPDQGAAEVSPASVMSEGTSAIVDEERVDRTDTSSEEQEDESFEHDEVVNAGVGTDLGSVVRQSATGAAVGAGKVPLVSYGLLLRRHVDLTTLAQAQLAVSRELNESDPIAPTAFLIRASAKALRAIPFAATNDVALAVIGSAGFGTRVMDDPATIPFRDLLKATREAGSWGQDNRSFALVVADMSALEIDEAVLNVGAPVLTLGRILYDSQDGRYRSTLSLSGGVSPDLGAKFLVLVADLLDSPVQLVL